MKYNLIVVLGPTASGKTKMAARIACDFGGEIISADSRQVYRGMDIGTGKDLEEYNVAGQRIECHLIDILDPTEEFSVFDFKEAFYSAFSEITAQGKTPVLAGGTGLYLDSVLRRYEMVRVPENRALRVKLKDKTMEELTAILREMKPALHNTTDLTERKRLIRAIEISAAENPDAVSEPEVRPLVIGIRLSREELRSRITARLRHRMEHGLIEEVKRLRDQGLDWKRLDEFGLEYRCVARHLRGELEFEQMVSLLNTRIHQFAKRQLTWFRRMERNGVAINWMAADDYGAVSGFISSMIGDKTDSPR